MNCYQMIAMMGEIGYDSNVPRQHRETPVQEMRGDDRMNEKLTITWLGHSCLKVEAGGYSVDVYKRQVHRSTSAVRHDYESDRRF